MDGIVLHNHCYTAHQESYNNLHRLSSLHGKQKWHCTVPQSRHQYIGVTNSQRDLLSEVSSVLTAVIPVVREVTKIQIMS